jgi:serine protease
MRRLRRVLAAAALFALGATAEAVESGAARHAPRLGPEALDARLGGQVIVQLGAASPLLSGRAKAAAPGGPTASIAAAAVEPATTGPQVAQALGLRLGLALRDGRALGPRMQVLKAGGLGSAALAARLAAEADVEWAVVDGRRFAHAAVSAAPLAPDDPLFPKGQTANSLAAGQWYLRAPTADVPAAANIVGAWATTQGSADVVVAVLDTGIRAEHPDLVGKVLPGYDFVSDTPTANDGNGRDADASDPGDWITSAENASGTFQGCGPAESSWHGTQVAAMIGANTNNGIGMAGAAPLVMLLPVRVLGKCGGYDSDIIAGMRWAAGLSVAGAPANTHPARVLNLSLGSPGACSAAYEQTLSEVNAVGAVVVVSAGNEGLGVNTPARCGGAIGVGGLRHLGSKSGFASLGHQLAISAPAGNCVNDVDANPSLPCLYSMLSATNTGTTGPVSATYTDAFNYELGTSFSAPQVAATAALMLSVRPTLTPPSVRSLLQRTARPFPSSGADSGVTACTAPSQVVQLECYCTTATCGAGMLDAQAAVEAASAGSGPIASFRFAALDLLPGSNVALDASSSAAQGGRFIVSYDWTLVGSPASANFSGGYPYSASGVTANVQSFTPDTVTVRLTVTDDQGASAWEEKSLRIVAGPPSPVLTLGSDHPTVGDTVALNSVGSSAQGAAFVEGYFWDVQTASGVAAISGPADESTATLSTSTAGVVTVRLTVTDSDGFSAATRQSVTIAPKPSGSSGGGGAFGPLWALGLLLLGLRIRR